MFEIHSAETVVTYMWFHANDHQLLSWPGGGAPCETWKSVWCGCNSFEGLQLFEFKEGWVGSCPHYFFFHFITGISQWENIVFFMLLYVTEESLHFLLLWEENCKNYLWYHKLSVPGQYSACKCVVHIPQGMTQQWSGRYFVSDRNLRYGTNVFNDKGIDASFDILR